MLGTHRNRLVALVVLIAVAAIPAASALARTGRPSPLGDAKVLPGADVISTQEVARTVEHCHGMDLLLRDTVSGGGLTLGPADGPGRLVPLPSDEPGRYTLECSDGYILELDTPPLAVAGSAGDVAHRLNEIQAEQTAAIDAIRGLTPGLDVVGRFATLFNGLHLRMSPEAAAELRRAGYRLWDNGEVRAALNQSVPLINADDVWVRNDGRKDPSDPLPGSTGRGVSIAILDTGIDYEHPDLGGCFGLSLVSKTTAPCSVAGGYDFVNRDADPMDDNGHGTHVAAIAGGNGVLRGVAPGAQLYAYKVLDKYGEGKVATVLKGLERAVDPNRDGYASDAADVINLSLGGYGDPDDPMSIAVDNAVRAGSVVVVAAGNDGYQAPQGTISSPGTSRNAITVGASTKGDLIAPFSSRGPVIWDGRAIVKPDLVAPGQDICSARHGTYGTRSCLDERHTILSGTSMAAPHVAGVAALLEEARPHLPAEKVKSILKGSAVGLSKDQSILGRGAGRVDALRATTWSDHPPVASLDPIFQTGSVRSVSGTVWAKELREWTLAYAPYRAPYAPELGWVEVVRSATLPDGKLLKGLPTTTIPDGRYIIRLTVEDVRGRQAVDYGYAEVDNVRLRQPLQSDILRGGDVVPVEVDLDPTLDVSDVTLEYAGGYNPTAWTTAAAGSPDMRWDTRGLAAGPYTLRLTVRHDGTVDREQIVVFLDPSLAPGWPVRLPVDAGCEPFTPPCPGYTGWVDPVAEDLDDDGEKEILFLRFAAIPELRTYRADGSLWWSSPVGSTKGSGPGFTGLEQLHLPVVADVDRDGEKDILVFNSIDSTVDVFSATGKLSQTWPLSMAAGSILRLPRMLLADVNADGVDEVVLSLSVFDETTGDRPKIVVLSTDGGAKLAEWFVTTAPIESYVFTGTTYNYAPAVGNLDDDAQLEIVAQESIASTIRAFDWDGTELGGAQPGPVGEVVGEDPPGWPVEPGSGQEYFPIAIGDLDGDGDEEVVAGFIGGDGALTRIWAIDGGGKVLPGWPAKFTDRYSTAGASLADLDGNGDLEIVVPLSGEVRAYNHDGTLVNGWPAASPGVGSYSAVVGDVDGDGAPDVLIHDTNASSGYVVAWSADGTPIPGFGLPVELSGKAPLLATELHGHVAVLASSDWDFYWNSWGEHVSKERLSLHMWELQASYAADAMPWPTYQHDAARTGRA